MEFIKTIRSSIYGPSFYGEISNKPFGFSLKYYLKLSLLIAVIMTAILSFKILPGLYEFFSQLNQNISAIYPNDLELKINEGVVTSSAQNPYFLDFPGGMKREADLSKFDHFVVIDTQNESLDAIKTYNTMILVTKSDLIFHESNGQIRVHSLRDVKSFTLNKGIINSFLIKIEPYYKLIGPFLSIIIFIGMFIALMLELVYLFFIALLVWAVSSIKKAGWNYAKSYQAGMHLVTFPLIIQYSINTWIKIPFFFTIAAVVMSIINISKIFKETDDHSKQA